MNSELELYTTLETDLMKHGPLFGEFSGVPWIVSASWFELTEQQTQELIELGSTLRNFLKACNTLYYEDESVRRILEEGKPPSIIDLQKGLRDQNLLLIRPDIVLTSEGYRITEIETVCGGLGMYSQVKDSYQALVPPRSGAIPYDGSIIHSFIDTVRNLYQERAPERVLLTPSFGSRYLPDLKVFSALCSKEGYEAVPVPAEKLHEIRKWDAKAIWRLFEIYEIGDLLGIPDIPIYPPLKQFVEEKSWMALLHYAEYEGYWIQALGKEDFHKLKAVIAPTWIVREGRLPLPKTDLARLSCGKRRYVTKLSGYSTQSWGARSFVYWPDRTTKEWESFLETALAQPGTPYVMQEYQESLRYSVPVVANGEIEQVDGLRAKVSPFYFFNGEFTQLADIGVILRRSRKVHGATDSLRLPVSII